MMKILARMLVLFGTSMALPVAAQAQVSLKGDVQIERIETVDGKTTRVLDAPKVVVPGDRLVFTTHYANEGSEPVRDLIVTNPVPPAVTVADDSAGALQVSVDGGQSFGSLASLRTKDAEGNLRPALAADITHIRWTVATIPSRGSGQVEYHGIVR